jgi:hypothetical protein
MTFPLRYKKTTPFAKECGWFEYQDETGQMDQCLEVATVGFYFDRGTVIKALSVCQYHAIVQESLFKAGQE